MRRWLLPLIAVVALAPAVGAQEPPSFPPGAVETEARLLTKAGPSTRAWIRQEAARESATGSVSEAEAVRAAAGYLKLSPSSTDVMALAFLVLMEAAKSTQEDLKAIMAQVKSVNSAKAAMRQQATTVKPGTALPKTTPSLTARPVQVAPKPLSKSEFDARLASSKQNRESLNELEDMTSLRLQMAMDRRSKLYSTLSNLLKKVSDTSASITQNLK